VILGAVSWSAWQRNSAGTVILTATLGDATLVEDGRLAVDGWPVALSGDIILELEIDLAPGKHEIEISKEGFERFVKRITVRPGERVNIWAVLRPEEVSPTPRPSTVAPASGAGGTS
jgi:hypothetical protein